MKRHIRYLILLLILLFVAVNEAMLRYRSTSWDIPLSVVIYVANADGRQATEAYVDRLSERDFVAIERFVNRYGKAYGLTIDAIDVEFGGYLDGSPPQPPTGESVLENIWWSLKFRGWAWKHAWGSDRDDTRVELFVNYYDVAVTQSLRHSVGLQGGLIGIINAFADKRYQGSNQVVITHELMHTLGASDKYDRNNLPKHPQGFAEPNRQPLYPQRAAEIMGGRIPLSASRAVTPESLAQVVIGVYTALEINWPVGSP
jgi:hypothetical protein